MSPQRVQVIRSSVKGQRPVSGSREPGELYVNFQDRQAGYVDASKNAIDLVAIRFFATTSDYVAGDFVVNGGIAYRAKASIAAGPFSAGQWDALATAADLGAKENYIAPGTAAQYWRGDKAWTTLDKAAVGLANVDNTSDANKPVSTAQAAALALKAPTASPTLTGTPIAPTASAGTASDQIATTQFVTSAVAVAALPKADIASPTFTGDPKAPTPAPGDNDTSIATTAFVTGAVAAKADLASPVFTGDPKAPTPAPGDSDTSIATTAFVAAALVASGGIPPGAIASFAMNSAPAGWLKANGATLSRTAYAALFAAIGTAFGAGDGSTTFALPDLRGEFPRYWDDGRGIDSGRSFGTWQDGDLAGHTHGVGTLVTGNVSADHSHIVSGGTSGRTAGHTHNFSDSSNSGNASANHSHTPTMVGAAASGGNRTMTGGTAFPNTNIDTGGAAHVHATTVSAATSGETVDHAHNIYLGTGGISTNHTHAITGSTAISTGTETRPRNIALLACIKY